MSSLLKYLFIFFFGAVIVLCLGLIFWRLVWMKNSQETKKTSSASVDTSKKTLRLSLEKLQPLDAGHFEVWVFYNDETRSLGKFQISKKGKLTDLSGKEIAGGEFKAEDDLSSARKIMITIEPEGDKNESPTQTVILEGNFLSGQAQLSFLEIDLSLASGKYVLETPSDPKKKDLKSGVWFVLPSGDGGMQPSLNLPKLSAGFKYESWIIHQGLPLSCGRFSDPARPDETGRFLGKVAPPPYPGEDFLIDKSKTVPLTFPLNLADGATKVVVSAEPDVSDKDPTGDGPFQLQFLTGMIPENAKALTPYDLIFDTITTFPKGIAKIES